MSGGFLNWCFSIVSLVLDRTIHEWYCTSYAPAPGQLTRNIFFVLECHFPLQACLNLTARHRVVPIDLVSRSSPGIKMGTKQCE